MSAIFGLFNKNGAPVNPAWLEAMAEPMARLGPDGGDIWCEGACGLGQLLLYNTPEALYESMPQRFAGGRAITVAARVDNRDELCDKLQVAATERPTMSDGELILRAYERWGEHCPRHIYGDWAFAVWHPEERRLFVARDHFGPTALHYIDTPHFFAFATLPRALLALPQVTKRLNEVKLAYNLAYSEGDPAQTLYQDIYLLQPAQTLTVTPQQQRQNCYWSLDNAPDVRLPSAEAYAEGLREILERTVRAQLRSHREVGVKLSGGLDSAGIAGFAAPQLASQGRKLFTYTMVPMAGELLPTGRSVADESPWVEAIVDHVGDIKPHYHDFADTSPVQAIHQRLEIQDQLNIAWANLSWLIGFPQMAQTQGVGTLIDGYMGNITASWEGLLRSQTWLGLLQNRQLKSGLRDRLIGLLPEQVVAQLKRWKFGRGYLQPWTVIAPEFANRIQLDQLLVDNNHDLRCYDILKPTQFAQHRFASARQQRFRGIQQNWLSTVLPGLLAGWYGLEARLPLADARLMTYCLGIPDRYFHQQGTGRALFRHAVADQLPSKIVWNRRRGYQGADFIARLQAHRSEVEQTLEQLQSEPLVQNYINLPDLNQTWSKLCATEALDQEMGLQGTIFVQGLACGLFLHRWAEGGNTI